MDSAIEVRYAGVVVGRATQVKDWSATGAFIGFTEPLPTGTAIELRGENTIQPARVREVIESSDPTVAGMRVSFLNTSTSTSPPPSSSAAPSSDTPAAPAPASAAKPAEAGQPQQQGGGGKRKRRR